jgi:hypothetical protein
MVIQESNFLLILKSLHQGSGVLCDPRVLQKLKVKFYMIAIRQVMLYRA